MTVIQTYLYQIHALDLQQLSLRAQTLLPVYEQEKASQIRHNDRRTMYLAGRVLLRRVLAKQQGWNPQDIPLVIGEKGKPVLASSFRPATHFNLAHSEDRLILAVSAECSVGVDIEHCRALDHFDELAKRVLHPDELKEFQQLSGDEQQQFFFRLWSAKEAFVKWCGTGISYGLNSIRVDVQKAQVLQPSGQAQLNFLEAPEAFHAALVWSQGVGETVVVQRRVESLFHA